MQPFIANTDRAWFAFLASRADGRGRVDEVNTGEHTEPVVDAAHIQPYLGPRSNHVQNGLVLTKEFHALFDLGYVTVTPDYTVRISPRIRDIWNNGRRYYEYGDRRLAALPDDDRARPSPKALAWHNAARFRT